MDPIDIFVGTTQVQLQTLSYCVIIGSDIKSHQQELLILNETLSQHILKLDSLDSSPERKKRILKMQELQKAADNIISFSTVCNCATTKDQILSLEASLDANTKIVNQLAAESTELYEKINQLETREKALNIDNQNLNTINFELEKKIAALTDRINENSCLQTENLQKNAEIDKLQVELKSKETELTNLSNLYASLLYGPIVPQPNGELPQIQTELARKCEHQACKIEYLEEDNKSTKNNIVTLQLENKELKSGNTLLSNRLQQKISENVQLNNTLKTRNIKIDDLTAKLKASTAEIEKLKNPYNVFSDMINPYQNRY